jgi:hypothetical protein
MWADWTLQEDPAVVGQASERACRAPLQASIYEPPTYHTTPYLTVTLPDPSPLQELRDLLTIRGHEESVWALANRKPAPRKADWVELAASQLA